MQTNNSLAEGSFVYQDLVGIYAEFSWAEDAEGEVYRYLLPRLKDCSVLDVGCGTGKYRQLFCPEVKAYVGLDSSAAMLRYSAKSAASYGIAPLVHGQAGELPFKEGSFDVVLGTWSFGSILDEPRRIAAFNEAKRVLRPGGKLYVVENAEGGEFEDLRGHHLRTEKLTRWFETSAGMRVAARIRTHFAFADIHRARGIFNAIWGEKVSRGIAAASIGHRIAIYEFEKAMAQVTGNPDV